MTDAYILPDGNVQIAFSGGRTSAYMLHHILEANGGLPDRVQVTFQNTGREMPATLDFVQEVSDRWGVPVVWLEYRAAAPFWERVSHNSASRNGEPFEQLIRKKKFVPAGVQRFCTIEMKIRTAKRYLISLGWKEWTNAIGIRADEPGRVRPEDDKMKERWFTWQPLNHAGVSKRDVMAFWDTQPFDLCLDNINGKTPLGNCDGCFLKSEATLAMLARDHPERHAWWESMEALAKSLGSRGNGGSFNKNQSRKQLRSFIERQGDWIFDTQGALCQANGGECTG